MMTTKEWAEEYRIINEAEREDLKRRLLKEPVEKSLRDYLTLCEFVVKLSPDAREVFADERRDHYLKLETMIRQAARSFGYAVPG